MIATRLHASDFLWEEGSRLEVSFNHSCGDCVRAKVMTAVMTSATQLVPIRRRSSPSDICAELMVVQGSTGDDTYFLGGTTILSIAGRRHLGSKLKRVEGMAGVCSVGLHWQDSQCESLRQ